MSILKKLSNVLRQVFWIKSSNKKKTITRRKLTVKKVIKKVTNKPKESKIVKIKKPSKPLKPVKVKKVEIDPNLVKIGEIPHYFDRIKVCVVKITNGTVLIGDKLTIVGTKNKFIQKVWSMQVESQDVKVAKKGQLIGLKVDKPVEVGDIVYK